MFRPPECFAENVVDASALDVWSIGVTTLELLTGGMLTIQAEWKHSGQRCQELIEAQGLLKLDNFSSAVDACWHYMSFLGGFNDVVKIDDVYNLSPCGFFRNSWQFVNSLLRYSPSERATISEALNAPFITKTINPKFVCSFKCFRSQVYVGICPK